MDETIGEREDFWKAFCDHFVNTTQETLQKVFLWKSRNDEEAPSQLHVFRPESFLLIRDC
jgi:hypothetical protein